MKKYITVFTLIVMLLTSSGCKKDFLDTRMDQFRTPEMLGTDRANLWSFATAFYTPLRAGFATLDGNLFAAATDEAQATIAGPNALNFNLGTMNPMNVPDNVFANCYEGIRAANFFLSFVQKNPELLYLRRDTIGDPSGYAIDKQNLKYYVAEAHIARAYYYMELIKRYGGVPIVEKTYEEKDNLYIPKSSYDDVVTYIVSEIDNNVANLMRNWKTPPTGFSNTSDGRFSYGSALAIKARVLLYAASPLNNPTNDVTRWQKAAAAARDLLNANPTLGYALNANYGDYFLSGTPINNNETIFAIRVGGSSNTLEVANYPVGTAGGRSGLCPTQNLVAEYEYIGAPNPTNPYANRDPRLAATVVFNGSSWNGRTINEAPGGTDDMSKSNTSKTGYYLKKFLNANLNLPQNGTAQHHWVVFRLGGLYLDYAEAMNEAYGPDAIPAGFTISARTALRNVRNRASTSLPLVTTTDVVAFRNALKHERKVELAFEDQRYWDLLRWKDAGTVLNQPVTGVKVGNGTVAGQYTYQVVNVASRTFNSPTNYYYPFSYSDIAVSKNTLIQNPGY